jgi:hypothetical protein
LRLFLLLLLLARSERRTIIFSPPHRRRFRDFDSTRHVLKSFEPVPLFWRVFAAVLALSYL